jgi:hypothetical protein
MGRDPTRISKWTADFPILCYYVSCPLISMNQGQRIKDLLHDTALDSCGVHRPWCGATSKMVGEGKAELREPYKMVCYILGLGRSQCLAL